MATKKVTRSQTPARPKKKKKKVTSSTPTVNDSPSDSPKELNLKSIKSFRYDQSTDDIKSRWVIFDYKKAVEYKKKYRFHEDNRDQTRPDIVRYAEQMAAGNWAPTHQGMGITKTGKGFDGQHRIEAIIYAAEVLGVDVTVPIMVTFGLDDAIFEVLDGGKNRRLRDALKMDGKDYPEILEIAARLHWIRCNGKNIHGTGKLTIQSLQDHIKKHPEIEKSVGIIMTEISKETPIKVFISPGYAAALLALQLKSYKDYKGVSAEEMAEISVEFWKRFVDMDVEDGHRDSQAARTVRKYIVNKNSDKETKLQRDALVGLLIAAINAYVAGDAAKNISDIKPKEGIRPVIGGIDKSTDE